MSKKNKNRGKERGTNEDSGLERESRLAETTVRIIYGVIFFVVALFFVFASLNQGGPAGTLVYSNLHGFFGVGYFLVPLILVVLGIISLRPARQIMVWPRFIGATVFFLAALGLLDVGFRGTTGNSGGGGILGGFIATPLLQMFDVWVTTIFLLGFLIISAVVMLDDHLSSLAFWRKLKKEPADDDEAKKIADTTTIKIAEPEASISAEKTMTEQEELDTSSKSDKNDKKKAEDKKDKKEKEELVVNLNRLSGKPFVPPPLSLLEGDKGKPGVGDIKANANIIKRTLQNFGINVEMDEISIGPSVTRYALKPAEGVKLSRIVGLQNDLALALAAHPIRIEAPIPGKSLVGIEIPNSTKTTVGLGTLLSSEEFQGSQKPLLVSLGRGISGKSHFADLGKMPHLLIAGATGSGKSVTIHTILTSLLYRNSPENLKFIMIDPKRVELTLYNNIPHLLTPVITEAKKSILSLKWAAKEMDRRYDILEAEKVRDVDSYHKNILGPALKKLADEKSRVRQGEESDSLPASQPELMPYIVIIIDELADLMQAYPRELESAIVRLAQMSRAVGIHLILSTQRPSVNVITGLIKANVPSRIALQVTSQIDSRTILDTGGAEKLLGAGDMLFMSGEMSKPQRIQSAYISEGEVKKVVKFFVDNYASELPNEISLTEGAGEKNAIFDSSFNDEAVDDDDDLYEEAREVILKAGKASTSYLQRKLRVGYARAARLIDLLEERGVIGPGEGAKPREVIDPIGQVTQTTEDQPLP